MLSVAACGGGSDDDGGGGGGGSGEALYSQPLSDGNTFACSTCHALVEPAPDGLTRPGHAIGNAFNRPNFKNGELGTLLEAVNVCRTQWQGAQPAWTAGDADWQALENFLAEQAGDAPADPIAYEIVAPPQVLLDDDVSGGDPARGREILNQTCVVCHGTDGIGPDAPGSPGLGPALIGNATPIPPSRIGEWVRRRGPPDVDVYPGLIGGVMPFWAADRLTDQDVIDLAAWINNNTIP